VTYLLPLVLAFFLCVPCGPPSASADPDGMAGAGGTLTLQGLGLMLTIPDGAVVIPAGPAASSILMYLVSSGPLTAWSEEEYPAKHWP
jgi:hypothetical protein